MEDGKGGPEAKFPGSRYRTDCLPWPEMEVSMLTKHLVVIIGLSVAALSPGASTAQEPTSASAPGVQEELHALGGQVGEAVVLLKQLVAQRGDELRLKRLQVAVLALQLRSTSIGEIEARIRTLEDRVATAREEAAQLEAEIERLETLAGNNTMPEPEREQLTSMTPRLEAQTDIVNNRVWSIERQILDLQNELIDKRRDVDALEDIVMEGLNGI